MASVPRLIPPNFFSNKATPTKGRACAVRCWRRGPTAIQSLRDSRATNLHHVSRREQRDGGQLAGSWPSLESAYCEHQYTIVKATWPYEYRLLRARVGFCVPLPCDNVSTYTPKSVLRNELHIKKAWDIRRQVMTRGHHSYEANTESR